MKSFLLFLLSFPLSLVIFLLSNIGILLIENIPVDFFSQRNRWKLSIAGLVAIPIFIVVMESNLRSMVVIPLILGVVALIGTVIFIFQIMRVVGFKFVIVLLKLFRFDVGNVSKHDMQDDFGPGLVGAAAILSCLITFLILNAGFSQPLFYVFPPAIFTLFIGPYLVYKCKTKKDEKRNGSIKVTECSTEQKGGRP